ncbi:DUF6584 family protein [Kitasatospora sp. NPDC092948]|uniref:DUF6584 family protein n=1 Tax=Kitasatospora sp. NPDC092948 TaxID=3364088 RepID=UPI003806C57A
MSVESTLAKAAADLREERVDLARDRLRGLLSSLPTDLTVRRELAHAYAGPPTRSEAGRWNYLDESLTTEQLVAFERQFRDPGLRLAALRWPDPDHNPPSTELARRRLAALHRRATGVCPDWPDHPDDAATPDAPLPPRPLPPPPVQQAPQPRFAPRPPELPMHVAAFRLTLLVAGGVALIALVLHLLG